MVVPGRDDVDGGDVGEGGDRDHREPRDGEIERSVASRRLRLVLLATLVVVVVAVVIGVLSRDDDARVVQAGRPWTGDSVRVIGRLPAQGTAIAATDVAVWIVDPQSRTVAKLDPDSGRVAVRSELPFVPRGVAALPSGIWVAGDGRFARADPATALVTEVELPADLPRPAGIVTTGGGAVWLATASGFIRYEPRTETARHVVSERASGQRPVSMAASEATLWIAGGGAGGRLASLALPALEARAPVKVDLDAPHLAYGAQALWAADPSTGVVRGVDPVTGARLADIDVGGNPASIAATDRTVWVLDRAAGELVRVALR